MSISGFWILLYYAFKKSVTLVPPSGVLVEGGQQDKLAVEFLATARRVIGSTAVTNQ